MTISTHTDWAEVERRACEFERSQVGPLPIDCLSEYDGAARWCAYRGLKGAIGDPLPANMDSDGALKWINADPEAFEQRVKEFAYGLAMERLNLPEL